jgi:hypothetical protein
MKSIDQNYFKKESFEYTTIRTSRTNPIRKSVILRKPSSLPNDNKIQLFFDEAFNSNPINSNESTTNSLRKGNEYYLLFDLIINNEETGDVKTFFSTDSNNIFIEEITTTGEYYRILAQTNNIDWSNSENLVDEKATFGMIDIKNVQGKKAFPILVKISIDENAPEKFSINYHSTMNEQQSLEYKKEFELGRNFYTNNPPNIIYNNYIKINNEWQPIDSITITSIYNDEEYEIKTIIENTTDTDFKEIIISNNIPETNTTQIRFEEDKNSIQQEINLEPLNETTIITKIFPQTNQTGDIQIHQKLYTKNNEIINVTGSNNNFSLKLIPKENLEIIIEPNNIKLDYFYPLFLIKTQYSNRRPAQTNWTIKQLIGEQKIELGEGYSGTTNEEGYAFTKFDTRQLKDGDKIIIEANNNDSNPAQKIIELKKTPQTIELNEPQNCLEINTNTSNNIITLNVEENANFSITEICGENKRIELITDLRLSNIDFEIKANQTENITVTATPKDNVFGVYPIRIFDKSLLREAGVVDVVIKSNNCFKLEQAIFDLTSIEEISSKITNECFEGRNDNFYPQMNINTQTVSLEYNKPGNPHEYNLNIQVMGTAIEGIIYGFGWGTYFEQKSRKGKTCSGSPSTSQKAPSELVFVREGARTFENYVEQILRTEMGDRPETEFDSENRPIGSFSNINENQKLFFSDGGINVSKDDKLEYYPAPIGDSTREPEGCEAKHEMEWMGAPRPPGLPEDTGVWRGVNEKPAGDLSIQRERRCNPCKVSAFSLEKNNNIIGILYTRGRGSDGWSWEGAGGGLVAGAVVGSYAGPVGAVVGGVGGAIVGGLGFASSAKRAYLDVQPEFYRSVFWVIERQGFWSEENIILPIEGRINDLGSYRDATPIPLWNNESRVYGVSQGDVWEDGDYLRVLLGVQPLGFIPREITIKIGDDWGVPASRLSSALPFVEADSSGLIHYEIVQSSVPDGINAFLRNGRLYAEYIGEPEIDSPNINFNVIRNNLFGTEYAIIQVSDWISKTEKQTQEFRIKLDGPTNNCISLMGLEGVTGAEFAPRLNFNWEWDNISINACDSTNNNYHYCDATQFNISLFKKLNEIDNLLKENTLHLIPQKTVFYSHLIKDNYSQNFLNDFRDYYTSEFASTEPYFNAEFHKLISNNKLSYNYNRQDTTQLEYGGLHRIEIDIEELGQGINSLFSQGEPVKEINITIIPIQRAPNYNPFYETPFNGLVGQIKNERKDYGVTVEGTQLKLNEKTILKEFQNAPKTIRTEKVTDLETLDSGLVLEYIKTDQINNLKITTSQPNPVVMLVDNNKFGDLKVNYSLQGTSQSLTKNWNLIGSTIGTNKCHDLNEIQEVVLAFNESRSYDYDDGRVRNPKGTTPEKYCRQITGTLFRECYDLQSCLLSCSAVPVCKYALEGIPQREEFLGGVQELQDDTNQLDEDISKIIEISEELKNLKYSEYDAGTREKTFEMSEKMKEIRDITSNIRSNFLFSDLLPHAAGLQSYCAPVNYSISAENNLNLLADTYSAKLRILFEIDDLVDVVYNETEYRKDLKVVLEVENEYTKKYNSADSFYQELYSKYVKVNKYVDDAEIRNDINLLRQYLDYARENIYSGDFSRADLNLRQFDVLSEKYNESIDSYYVEVVEIELLQSKVDKKFIMAEWDVSGIVFQLGSQLNDLRIKRGEVDKRLGARVSLEELEEVKVEYEDIHDEINDIIKVKREQMLDTTLTTLVIKSNEFSNSFSSILGTVGVDYESRRTSREYVFPLTLIIGSLFIVGGFMASFVYLVGSGKVRLHKVAAMLWSFIFISFFVTVSGGAIATYLLINEKSVNSTFDTFYHAATMDDTIAIVLDERKGSVDDVCAQELTRVFENQMNKTVVYYRINHNECLLLPDIEGDLNPEKMSFDECDEMMDPFTKIRIVKGEESKTSFALRYASEATIEGDNFYINSCELAIILDEEI